MLFIHMPILCLLQIHKAIGSIAHEMKNKFVADYLIYDIKQGLGKIRSLRLQRHVKTPTIAYLNECNYLVSLNTT